MAQASPAPRVKMICGMISSQPDLFGAARENLENLFGPVDLESEIMDFDFTHYYDREMGHPLWRRFVAFDRLVTGESLVEAKLQTNALEARFSAAGGASRPINLDPGYLESSKLVLASMKNFSHRIYLGRGVYAEVTLQYHKGRWDALPWTFPDYASGRYHPFLTAARERLRAQTEGQP